MTTRIDPDRWLLATDPELARLFRRSPRTIARLLSTGAIPSRKVGHARYVLRADIDAMLAPARQLRAELETQRAAGEPIFTPEQLALVRRVVEDALATATPERATA